MEENQSDVLAKFDSIQLERIDSFVYLFTMFTLILAVISVSFVYLHPYTESISGISIVLLSTVGIGILYFHIKRLNSTQTSLFDAVKNLSISVGRLMDVMILLFGLITLILLIMGANFVIQYSNVVELAFGLSAVFAGTRNLLSEMICDQQDSS